jgi:hypothetical protein
LAINKTRIRENESILGGSGNWTNNEGDKKIMGKHTLFILNPGFFDREEGPFFCPHNAAIEGLLKYAPELETKLDVRRIDFKRPRPAIVELLGKENQNTPVLVREKKNKKIEQEQKTAQKPEELSL